MADWFGIKTDNFSGNLWNINTGVGYKLTKKLGLNIAYKYLRITAGVNKRFWEGNFYMRFHGPVISVTGSL